MGSNLNVDGLDSGLYGIETTGWRTSLLAVPWMRQADQEGVGVTASATATNGQTGTGVTDSDSAVQPELLEPRFSLAPQSWTLVCLYCPTVFYMGTRRTVDWGCAADGPDTALGEARMI